MKCISNTIVIFRELVLGRKVLVYLAIEDFKRKFSGTSFGGGWAIVQPLCTLLVYWLAFQFGFRSGDVEGISYTAWFICGIVPWLYFADSFSAASNAFVEYSYLIKKMKFNISILPYVKLMSSFYIHLFFCLLAILIDLMLNINVTIYLIQIVYYMLAMIVLLAALSMIFSSIGVFFRDVNQIIGLLLLMGMWGSPIAWPLNIFSYDIQMYLKLNPFCYIAEGYRDALLGRAWFWESPVETIYFWTVVLILYIVGCNIFMRLRKHFSAVV